MRPIQTLGIVLVLSAIVIVQLPGRGARAGGFRCSGPDGINWARLASIVGDIKYSVLQLMQMSQIQAVNGLGSLLFLVFLLTAIGLAALIVYRRLKRRSVRSIGLAMLASIGVYAAALVGFSLASHYRILPLGTDKCFDDWCATVTSARSLPNPTGDSGTKFVAISLRISNRGGRAAFRPSQRVSAWYFPPGTSAVGIRSAGV